MLSFICLHIVNFNTSIPINFVCLYCVSRYLFFEYACAIVISMSMTEADTSSLPSTSTSFTHAQRLTMLDVKRSRLQGMTDELFVIDAELESSGTQRSPAISSLKERRRLLIAEISAAETVFTQLERLVTHLQAPTSPSSPALPTALSPGHAKRFHEQANIIKDMSPTDTTGSKDFLDFLSVSETRLQAHQVPITQWTRIFQCSFVNSVLDSQWYSSDIIEKGLTWLQARSALLLRFASPEIYLGRMNAYLSIRQATGELTRDYIARFRNVRARTFSTDVEAQLFLRSLLPELSGRIKQEVNFRMCDCISQGEIPTVSLEDVLKLATRFGIDESPNETVFTATSSATPSGKAKLVKRSSTSSSGHSQQTSFTPHCYFCGFRNHELKDCHAYLKSGKPTSHEKFKKPRFGESPSYCFLCNERGHFGRWCPSVSTKEPVKDPPPQKKNATHQYVSTTEDDVVHAPITVPLLFNGHEHLCILDTGADTTVIDAKLADDFGIQYSPVEGHLVTLGGARLPRKRSCTPVLIRSTINSASLIIDVTVLTKPEILLGRDALHALKITIGNLPHHFPRQHAEILSTAVIQQSVQSLQTPPTAVMQQPVQSLLTPSDTLIEQPILPTIAVIDQLTTTSAAERASDPSMLAERDHSLDKLPRISPSDVDTLLHEKTMACIADDLNVNKLLDATLPCTHPRAMIKLRRKQGVQLSYIPQYSVPYSKREAVQMQIDKWLKEKVVIPATTGCPYNSPLTASPKKDLSGLKTDLRICLDPRAINKVIDSDGQSMPKLTHIHDRLAGMRAFSTLDLAASFTQLPVDPASQELLAFTFNGKQYQFVRGVYGVKTLSQHFQRLMEDVLLDHEAYVAVSTDDILIFTPTDDTHPECVRSVIANLNKHHLRLNIEKCVFGARRVTSLGHIVGVDGIHFHDLKVADVMTTATPTSAKQLRSFIGFVNFLRHSIRHFSDISAHLEKLKTLDHSKFIWDSEAQTQFNAIKQAISSAPLRHAPDFSKPFVVQADASNTGVGGVLLQPVSSLLKTVNELTTNTEWHIITCCSRVLLPYERNYPITKKELLAVLFCLRKWDDYLCGRHFLVMTDHRALTYIFTRPHLTPHVAYWLDILLEYDFDIIHLPGHCNVTADALSRRYEATSWGGANTTSFFSSSSQPLVDIASHSCPSDAQVNAVTLSKSPLSDSLSHTEMLDIIKKVHALGHIGFNAIFYKLHELGHTWTGIRNHIEDVLLTCRECQRFTVGKHGFHPLQPISASQPFDHIAIDLMTKLPRSHDGYVNLLVVVDVFTRMVFLRPLKTKKAGEVAQQLWLLFTDFGVPRIMQSDNGKEFVNHVLTHITTHCGIDARLITPYHPRANGLVERMNSTVTAMLAKMLQGYCASWPSYIPSVQLAINNKIATLHKSTPFALFYGRTCNMFADYRDDTPVTDIPQWLSKQHILHDVIYPVLTDAMKAKKAKQKAKFDAANRILDPFQPGTSVMVRDVNHSSKFDPRYAGPFTVVQRQGSSAYVLQRADGSLLPSNTPISMIKSVKPTDRERITPTSSTSTSVDDIIYEVEVILNHRVKKGELQYLVRWKGFDESYDLWEPYSSFDATECISEYWRRSGRSKTQ